MAMLNFSGCADGDIRLAGSESLIRGRVEICYGGVWGTVCGNNWSQQDANIVCRQLHNGTYGKKVLTDSSTPFRLAHSNWSDSDNCLLL